MGKKQHAQILCYLGNQDKTVGLIKLAGVYKATCSEPVTAEDLHISYIFWNVLTGLQGWIPS